MPGGVESKGKPPLGIMPRKIWETDRMLNILAALARYVEDGFPIPSEWFTELIELNEEEWRKKE